MKIGIDMDNVICDTGRYLIDKIKEYDKSQNRETVKRRKYKNIYEMFGYDQTEKRRFDKIYMPIMHKEVPVVKDAVKIINKLKKENNEIFIISYRGTFQYENYLEVTKKWLDSHGLMYDKLITERWDKGEVCKDFGIDLLIDDEPVHIYQAKDKNVNGFLFNSLFNGYNVDLNRVYSWKEIYNLIKK